MLSSALLALTVALLAATTGANKKMFDGVIIKKCCDVHKMLSADGKRCVRANWPRDVSVERPPFFWRNISRERAEWVRRWLPPGLPMENISGVHLRINNMLVFKDISSVNSSSLLNPHLLRNEALLRNTVVFFGQYLIARPKPGGGYREAVYCVDAARPPLGPFALRFKTGCQKGECANKCCRDGQLVKDNEGLWKCQWPSPDYWLPNKSSLAVFDTEFPYTVYDLCEQPRLLPFEGRYDQWTRHSGGIHFFQFSTWTTCFDFYSIGNGGVKEGFFYCEFSRITRGVYWLLRPLCFLSALLLTVSLLSVASNKSMRRKIHGRCLVSHAACLLVFNIGQIMYYIAISDRLDAEVKELIPPDLQMVCKYFALSSYFVLTSAWFWLTALCINMARGFRLHMPRWNKGCGKRFLAISAFAWGLPAVLTITCSILFIQPRMGIPPPWYTPSFMETRTCFIEPLGRHTNVNNGPFVKSGTALFYYGPVCFLVISNIICLALTLRKVQELKRGNSVIRREEDQIPLGQRHLEGNNPPTAHTATGNGQTPEGINRRGTTVDAKTIKLYIKMVLISGGIELLTEVIMWLTTHNNIWDIYEMYTEYEVSRKDRDLAYRAAGYATDFFRAAIVTWLAAPEGGYLGLVLRMLRRDKREERSAGAGDAGRRKRNVA